MPYILVNTSLKMTAAQKEKVKAEFGRLITIIPTKSEAGLLVDFSDGHTMYRAGEEVPSAFIEMRHFGKAELEPRKKFIEEVFKMLKTELGLEKENVYMNILEFDTWGSSGTYDF